MIKKVAKWAHCVSLTFLFYVDLGAFEICANLANRGIRANLANLTNLAIRLANLMIRVNRAIVVIRANQQIHANL